MLYSSHFAKYHRHLRPLQNIKALYIYIQVCKHGKFSFLHNCTEQWFVLSLFHWLVIYRLCYFLLLHWFEGWVCFPSLDSTWIQEGQFRADGCRQTVFWQVFFDLPTTGAVCSTTNLVQFIFILSLFMYFYLSYFLSSARTAPEPGHSRFIDPGHNRIKVKVKSFYQISITFVYHLPMPLQSAPAHYLLNSLHNYPS